MNSLYTQQLISFNHAQGQWQWDLTRIQAQEITDNVVDLLADQIHRLPENTQQALKLAACIGNQFDLQTLSIIHEHSSAETLHELWDALQAELIIPLDDSYKYVEAGIDLSGFQNLTGLRQSCTYW